MVSAIVTTLHTDGRLDSSPKMKPKHVDPPPGGCCAAVKVINHHAHFTITDGKWARLKYTFCSNDGFHHFR